jgi:hypothetical protein
MSPRDERCLGLNAKVELNAVMNNWPTGSQMRCGFPLARSFGIRTSQRSCLSNLSVSAQG